MNRDDTEDPEIDEEYDEEDDPFIYVSEDFAVAPTESGGLDIFRLHGSESEGYHLHDTQPEERQELVTELREFLQELDPDAIVSGPIPGPGAEQDQMIVSLIERVGELLPEEDEEDV